MLLEAARRACLEAAQHAYEDAGIRGLCGDGRWECALAAIRAVDLTVLSEPAPSTGTETGDIPDAPDSAEPATRDGFVDDGRSGSVGAERARRATRGS